GSDAWAERLRRVKPNAATTRNARQRMDEKAIMRPSLAVALRMRANAACPDYPKRADGVHANTRSRRKRRSHRPRLVSKSNRGRALQAPHGEMWAAQKIP